MQRRAVPLLGKCGETMNKRIPLEIHIGDKVRMRKAHPCGGYEWEITRIGADIGMRCLTCKRRVMLPRGKFEKRVKAVLGTGKG